MRRRPAGAVAPPLHNGDAGVTPAGEAGPVNGPDAAFNVDGFWCLRTGGSERGLPSADYACGGGQKKVTFHRT
ncbi:MAG TPA: hypothetical protein VNT52_03780 [Acidimicrobiales bacterium]|nr:hypothetical protein [Acidimicrobiales bacterium]